MNHRSANLLSVAPFTMFVLAINLALYCVSTMRSGGPIMMQTDVLASLGASQRERLWDGEWLRLIAPMFLHGGALHIFMNMTFLWRGGPDAEVYFGTSNFGTIYLLSGITGVCLSQIFGGHMSIGASGSLCGISGAYLGVLIKNAPVPRYAYRNSAVRAQALSLAFLLFIGICGFFPGGMDNWGHFGGMITGFALGISFDAWRDRSAAGKLGVLASVIIVAALVCSARWTVFNPTYHIYEVARARQDPKDSDAITLHTTEARKWAGIWTPLHFLGVLNVGETDAILRANESGDWTREDALDPGGMMVEICEDIKHGRTFHRMRTY